MEAFGGESIVDVDCFGILCNDNEALLIGCVCHIESAGRGVEFSVLGVSGLGEEEK